MSSSSSFSSHATVTYTYVSTDTPYDDGIPLEDQPLPADASPIARSPSYIADFEPIEDDSEEDPEMDPIDYPSDEEEEEEPSAPTDPASHVPNSVPSSEETELFETDESAATPPLPHTVVPLSHTGLHRARKTVPP
ncbi:hypothetical protein Tco_0394593 [Tanacetum coccineum]